MLTIPPGTLERSARRLASLLGERGVGTSVIEGVSAVGGGAFPAARLPTSLVRIDEGGSSVALIERALREADPPVVARIIDDHVVLDPRTLLPGELEIVADVLGASRTRPADDA